MINVSLPKWPALVVKGERVTRDQAAEIIVRTTCWPVSSNSHAFDSQANVVAGFAAVPEWRMDHDPKETPEARRAKLDAAWNAEIKARDALGCLSLNYLHNHRVTSAYIGGPHGWCSWDGDIFCDSYNIGKHPSVEEVEHDWATIAKEWPFLNLRSQLFNGEQCEEGVTPVVEFTVANGIVSTHAPSDDFNWKPHANDFNPLTFLSPSREIGVSIENLTRAVAIVREVMKQKNKK